MSLNDARKLGKTKQFAETSAYTDAKPGRFNGCPDTSRLLPLPPSGNLALPLSPRLS